MCPADLSRVLGSGVRQLCGSSGAWSEVKGKAILYLSCVLCSSCVFLGGFGVLGFPVSEKALRKEGLPAKAMQHSDAQSPGHCPECLGAVLPTGAAGEGCVSNCLSGGFGALGVGGHVIFTHTPLLDFSWRLNRGLVKGHAIVK